MILLLKIEWLKIKKYPAFWWMLGIVLLTYPGINLLFYNVYENITKGKEMANNIAKILLGNPFAFPETFQTVAYFSSFFVLLPAILVIMLITNEYQYRTHKQNIIDGWSRQQFMGSKLIDVMIISFLVTLVFISVAIGFGIYSDALNRNRWAEQLQYIPLFYLQTFSQLSIAFLLGYLVKKAFISLGIFLFYYLIIENILVGVLKLNQIPLGRFLPFEMSDGLLVAPAFMSKMGDNAKEDYELALTLIPQQVVGTIILTAIIWLICFKIHQKKDLV